MLYSQIVQKISSFTYHSWIGNSKFIWLIIITVFQKGTVCSYVSGSNLGRQVKSFQNIVFEKFPLIRQNFQRELINCTGDNIGIIKT